MTSEGVPEPRVEARTSGRVVSFWTRQAPPDVDAVRRLYQEGKTEREIARRLGVSRRQVAEALAEAGVERRRSGLPRPVSREALYALAVEKGLSQARLAKMFGVADATVGIWLAECGLGEPDPRLDHDQLRHLYAEARLTTREIAARLGVSHHRVIRELALAGIPRRARYERPPKGRRATLTAEALRQLYVEQGLSIEEIAESAGVSTEFVCNRLHEHRLAKRPGSFRPKTRYTAAELRALAAELYEANGLTMRQVAIELGVSASSVRQALHEALIPVRRGGPPDLVGGQSPGQMVRDLYCDPAVAAVLRRHQVFMPNLDDWHPAGPFESFAPLPLAESLLRELYVDLGLSMFHVSLVCGVGTMSVLSSLKRYGIPLRDNRQVCPWYERTYLQGR